MSPPSWQLEQRPLQPSPCRSPHLLPASLQLHRLLPAWQNLSCQPASKWTVAAGLRHLEPGPYCSERPCKDFAAQLPNTTGDIVLVTIPMRLLSCLGNMCMLEHKGRVHSATWIELMPSLTQQVWGHQQLSGSVTLVRVQNQRYSTLYNPIQANLKLETAGLGVISSCQAAHTTMSHSKGRTYSATCHIQP